MLVIRRLLLVSMVIASLAALQVSGQGPLNAADSERIGHLLDQGELPGPLHCSIQPLKPLLDFAFRFDVGYLVTCSLSRFEGRASEVRIFARVTPEGGKPLLLGQSYRLPEVTKSQNQKQNIQMSGGFAVGEGEYRVEVLVGDLATGRTSRKDWRVRVARSRQQGVGQVAVAPGTVLPIGVRPWPIKMDTTGKGLRVTVLLDASPLNPRTPTLRAWDRAFLLESLSSLLEQVPCAAVRLRAFNLDQQRELFRWDQFDDAGFMKLEEALQTLELGTVSYRVLQQRQGWLELLLRYAREELIAAKPSDVVIFLGPWVRYGEGFSRDRIPGRETPNPHFYYFEYFPYWLRAHPPDALGILTKRLDGTVYEIASPADLARSVQKMLARVQAPGK